MPTLGVDGPTREEAQEDFNKALRLKPRFEEAKKGLKYVKD